MVSKRLHFTPESGGLKKNIRCFQDFHSLMLVVEETGGMFSYPFSSSGQASETKKEEMEWQAAG